MPAPGSLSVKTVAVVGSGTMGNGIAHVFAVSGFPVALIDVSKPQLDKALAAIRANLSRQSAKGVLSRADAQEALSRIKTATSLEDAGSADVVIEAVPENEALKREIFERLDRSCRPGAVLATNTSSIPIARLASATKRPDKVIGMHFMNPVPVMRLIEIIRGDATSEETYQTVHELSVKLGKTPVCSRDFPGFISNRVLMPMINEAAWALYQGVATKEDIDTVMKLGMNHPMGPLALADYIGLDTCLCILKVLEEGFRDRKYKPCPLFEEMTAKGRLGKKAGKGFYDY